MTPESEARGTSLELFEGDAFRRALARAIGVRDPGVAMRSAWLVALTWGVTAAVAWVESPGLGTPGRTSFFYDLSAHAQLLAFIPLSIVGEAYVGSKMRFARERLRAVISEIPLTAVTAHAVGLGRARLADVVCLALAYVFTAQWAIDEVSNGLPSWHSELTAAGERFTAAGLWTVVVALPLFTFMWLRWAWKVCVWTWLLWRVSRLPMRLFATHPDRTGGLGCLSDVQTSFAIMLFASGLLFAAFLVYKVRIEGNPLGTPTVAGPLVGYARLAPSAFLAPLFLFTRPLYHTRERALVLYTTAGSELAARAEAVHLGLRPDALDLEPETARLEEMRTAYESVERMRVVPFDLRSVAELFGSALGPFLPLADFIDLAENLRRLWGP